LNAFLSGLRAFWTDTLRQPDPGDLGARITNALSVPFVDYARGDGRVLGPTSDTSTASGDAPGTWTPILIDDATGWVDGYRGLFGLDTHDRFAGERAPAGPKYTRSGAVRQSWHDPLGFLGLAKVAPPHKVPEVLAARITALAAEREAVEKEIDEKSEPLHGLGLEVQALSRDGAMAAVYDDRRDELQKLLAELDGKRRVVSELKAAEAAATTELARVNSGATDDPAAHLKHAMHPVPIEEMRYGRVVEFWAAISAGLILLVVASLLLTGLVPLWAAFTIAIIGYALLEATFRRRLTSVLLGATVLLAVIAVIDLAIRFASELVIFGVILLAVIVLIDNMRELRGR
jgi:hypothetical protein